MNSPHGRLLVSTLVFWSFPLLLSAQPRSTLARFPEESVPAQNRLLEVERLVQPGSDPKAISFLLCPFNLSFVEILAPLAPLQILDEKTWDEALTECLRLSRDLGDSLVPLGEPSPISTVPPPLITVRRKLAILLSQWPASIRQKYRDQIESGARGLLEQGLTERSDRPLRRLIEETFLSHAGGEALELLGDLAFSRGELQEALGWWALLSPLPRRLQEEEEPVLRHPDATVDLARVRAKQVLAVVYLGDRFESNRQRDAFAALHPRSAGSFAGQKGNYLTILDELIGRFTKVGTPALQEDWSSLGGGPTGHVIVPQCPPERLWLDGPTWTVPLPESPKRLRKEDDLHFPAPYRPVYHPLLLGERVVLADSQSITVYHLASGKELFRHVWPEAAAKAPSPHVPAFVSTGEGDLVVARIGQPPETGALLKKAAESTWLVGVDLRPEFDKAKRVRWKAAPPAAVKGPAYFNGPPLLYQGRVWAPYRELKGLAAYQGVASLNPETGLWLTTSLIADAPPYPPGRDGNRQPALLIGAGNLVVCCSQKGVVAALDARTGKVAWGFRYPTQGTWTRRVTPSVRELAVPLYSLGRLYVAPQDSDLLLCLEGQTGQVLWEREALDVVQLLGCSQGKLVFTTASGLRTVSAETGSDHEGWRVPEEGRITTKGRGLILGEWIFWPTADPTFPVRVLSVAKGKPEGPFWETEEKHPGPVFFGPALLRQLPAGNYAYGGNCLVVADEKELKAFVRPALLLEERKERAKKERTPLAEYLLALAEVDAGLRQEGCDRLRTLMKGGPKTWSDLSQDRLFDFVSEKDRGAYQDHHPGPVPKEEAGSLSRERRDRLEKHLKKAEKPLSWRLPLQESFRMDGAALLPAQYNRLTENDGKFLVRDQDNVSFWNGRLGIMTWQLPWTEALTWSGRGSDLVFLAGPDKIVAVSPSSGKVHWTYHNPVRVQDRPVLEGEGPVWIRAEGKLNGFTLTDWSLAFFVGRDCLVLHDQNSKAINLTCNAGTGIKFQPWIRAKEEQVLLQTEGGKVFRITGEGYSPGKVDSFAKDFLTPPVHGSSDKIVTGHEAGTIICWDLTSKKEHWRFQPDGISSLTGQPARLIKLTDSILAITPRTLGEEMVCLDFDTGKVLWQRETSDFPKGFPIESLCTSETHLYWIETNHLSAVEQKTGKTIWQEKLPVAASNWNTQYQGGFLLVHPAGAARVLPPALEPFPSLALAWQTQHPLAKDEAAFFLIDPVQGRLVQRIHLERGPGPYRAQPCAAGVVLGNGREVIGFAPAR